MTTTNEFLKIAIELDCSSRPLNIGIVGDFIRQALTFGLLVYFTSINRCMTFGKLPNPLTQDQLNIGRSNLRIKPQAPKPGH